MTREQLLAAVEGLYAGPTTEEEDVSLLNRLAAALPHSKISDLIFWDFRGLTPEQVVEEALRREAAYRSATANNTR